MNLRSTLALVFILPAFAPALSRADTPAPANAAGAPSKPDEDKDTDLEMRMKRMAKAFRQLKKQVADPAQNASSLDLVATILAASKEAVEFTPQKAADLPADQRDKFVADYKSGIKDLQGKLGTLTDALTAGKNDEAAKIVNDILDFEKKSHKEFKKPENH